MKINRDELIGDLYNFARGGSGVIIGPPGIGKSYLLLELRKRLQIEGLPHLLLAIDQLGDGTETELREILHYEGDLIKKLQYELSHTKSSKGLILLDAFDAARSEKKRKNILKIIERIINELDESWNVIVTVRTYDALKSQELLKLFKPKTDLPPNIYLDKDINCRHFVVPFLNKEEISHAINQITSQEFIYDSGSKAFKDLLRIPYNIWLLSKILNNSSFLPDLSNISSEVQLLGLFWRRRIKSKENMGDLEYILLRVVRLMVQNRSLSVRKEDVYSPDVKDAWRDLFSEEVLIEISSTAQRVSFSHNILFDFAVSMLLIEDNVKELVNFLSLDKSRLLFLRPSLVYHFTRLWYDSPDLFWDIFWKLLPNPDSHIRLFARILPTGVIADEARKINELNPIIKSLVESKPLANDAVLNVIQSIHALEIERDLLWIQFLELCSRYLNRYFAWELARMTSIILTRAEKTEADNIKELCGRIGRCLLIWTWKQRIETKDAWIDSFGAFLSVPLVARTFGTDCPQSKCLLENVLSMMKEEDFPITYLDQIIRNIDKIWQYDPEFVASIYITVFSHQETTDEKTHFGSPILLLQSTRKQDYDMCQYGLIQKFQAFLAVSPKIAIRAVIQSLNKYILIKHVLPFIKDGYSQKDVTSQFEFRGKKTCYIPDGSYIWDESPVMHQPIKMGTELFNYISNETLYPENRIELNTLLNIFGDSACVAFFWRRLLKTASKEPEVFAESIFDLCVARPVQKGAETLKELGDFLEVASTYFTEEQRMMLERSIVSIIDEAKDCREKQYLEHDRNRLIARIPKDLLITVEAKDIRESMEKANMLIPNEPLAKISTWSEPFSEEKLLEDQGVDLHRPENKALRELQKSLNEFATQWQNRIPAEESIATILPVIKESYDSLSQNCSTDKAMQDALWNRIGESCVIISYSITDPESEEFQLCRKILLSCSKHDSPNPNPEYDSKFNFPPHWFPAPRNYAASGLPRLAEIKSDQDMLISIKNLAFDKVPSVRFLVTSELMRLAQNNSKYFWEIVEDIVETEDSKVVRYALCQSISHLLLREEEKSIKIIDKLLEKEMSQIEDTELLDALTNIIIWLVINRNNKWATESLNAFLNDPIGMAKPIGSAAQEALKYLKPQNIDLCKDNPIVDNAIVWLKKIINVSADGISKIRATINGQIDERSQKEIMDIYSIIDDIVARIYFAEVYILSDDNKLKENPVSREQRLVYYSKIKPLLEQILEFTSDKSNGLMFAPTAHYFMELLNGVLEFDPKGVLHMAAQVVKSGEPYNYNLDHLALQDIIELSETMLADHRGYLHEDDSLNDLLDLIDIFAKTGWPQAIRLVWRLDEVFR
jgi:hypothetical protein